MANKDTQTAYLRGEAYYAKILGDPILNYSKDGKEWKMDLKIDKAAIKELKALGIGDRVKMKAEYLDGSPFISFKQKEFRTVNGEDKRNDNIKVVDAAGKDWDQSRLIGNGSKVDVKFVVKDWGVGKKNGVYIRAVRVLDHVPFERSEFADLDEDDEYFTGAVKTQDDFTVEATDLDDEIPF